MNKVFIQPIHYENESIDQERPNVRLRVKNTATLDEFTGETYLNPQYLDKVQRWVRKNKFSCTALNNDLEMELKVEIFKFQLQKQSKGDIETLKQDIAAMRKENAQLKGQMKLFRYYFLNLWRDKQHRNAIAEKPDFRQELVQSTQALFDEVNAQGLIVEEFGAKTYYLTFMHGKLSEVANYHSAPGATPNTGLGFTPGFTPSGHTPMSNMIQTQQAPNQGSEAINNLIAWCQEMQEQQSINGNQANIELEVFLSGGNYSYKKASLDIGKLQETGEGVIMIRANTQLELGTQYTVFVPKKLV